MRLNKKILSEIFLLMIIIAFSNFFSAYMETNFQAFQFGSGTTTNFSKEMCQQGQDFLIQISPFGCTPAVVRSDLLEESDVPVYCQLGATKINPLIEVQAIDSISFSGTYSPQVSGVGFHPAKSALGVQGQLNTPVLSNIGYVVIVLKKQANISSMPDYVAGNLSAKIKYNINNAFGIGKALFYLPEISSDEDFQNQKDSYSFWSGRGYLRADNIESDSAQISLYTDTGKLSSVNLKKGETSQSIYLPGFECQAGLKLKLESLDNADTRAKLRVNAEIVEVAKNEKFLDNKCQITNLQPNGIVQRVGLRCQEDTGSKNFDLTISPRLILSINGKNTEVSLGQKLYESGDKGIYLGYIGAEKDSKEAKDLFVYLISKPQKKDNLTEEEISSVTSLVRDLTGAGQKSTGIIEKVTEALNVFAGLSISLGRAIGRGEILYRINFNDKNQKFFGGEVSIVNFAGAQDKELADNVKEQYENAKKDYETIVKEFASEAYKTGTTTFGEEALYKEIMLAWDASQKKTVSDLCKEFVQAYPHSSKIIKECSDSYKLSNQEVGEVYVTINKQIKKISFDGIYEPSFEDYGARVMVSAPSNGGNFDLRKSELVSGTGFSLQLVSLDENSARVQISAKTDAGTKTEVVNLVKGTTNDFEKGYSFTLTKINLKRVAKVSVTPNIDNSGTQTNFSFKIGIEKSAIKLAPEQTKEIIKKLNGWINTWNNISEVLGKGVEGLKTACIVTSVTLVAKNFIENVDGMGIARQSVMRGTNGWFEKCAQMVAAKTSASQEKCFLDNADKIDKDVAEMGKIISEQNVNQKKLAEGITSTQFLSENIVNTSALMKKYSEQQIPYLQQNLPDSALVGPNGEKIDKAKILDILSYDNWNKGQYSLEQLKEIELYTNVLKDTSANPEFPELREAAKARLYSVLSDIQTNSETYLRLKQAEEAAKNNGLSGMTFKPYTDQTRKQEVYDGSVASQSLGEIPKGELVQGISYGNKAGYKEYLVTLKDQGNNAYTIKDVYTASGAKISEDESNSVKAAYSYFQKYDSSSYNNPYQNAQIKYYETEPYKGMPAIVPFDLKNGWYAATKPILPSGGNIQPYDASGRLNSFWLCNVGANKLEEFQTVGDDTCQMINLGTGQPYNVFPGITDTKEVTNLVKKGQGAIEQASGVSESQRKGSITIAGQKIQVGSPAVDIPQFQCQDFMSPKDCLLLFNVCDPVICSSSRCNLGGAYPVRDVVQSGIIGSIALCLPNAQQGILIPVCLTGIKAGIDGFLSVLTATKDCLQESLDTGKNVGVCDEIFSVYMCDFFWKQALPFADMIIPKIVGTALGQNTQGGGEYLGASSAWSMAEKSVNYFTNYYAANAKQAFVARTTETIQGEFCKLFISGVVPSGGDFLNTLTAADSPSQFTGRFEEIPFTSVTVPPTSHYKVFFHIFAGKDSGAYYQVYLRGASGSSYYQDTSSNYNVASGYIAVGGYASETKDFIATSGYRELCISVNGQEKCGFQEVSTSFALNYVKDEYLASQATEKDIKTESNCISGSASAYSLLSGNIQSAAEEMINPAIYDQGITRICATANPGQGTDTAVLDNPRWVDVGYCDNSKIRCWLDTESVKDVIKTTTVEGAALKEVTGSYLEVLRNQGGYLSKDEVSSAVQKIEKEKDNSTKIKMINEIFEKVFWSSEKALLLNLRADSYAGILKELLKAVKPAAISEETQLRIMCEGLVKEGIFKSYDECIKNKGIPPKGVVTPTVTPEEKPAVTPPEKELTKEEILKLTDARQRVLAAAKALNGTIVPGEKITIGGRTLEPINKDCFTSTYYGVYLDYAEVNKKCVASDSAGTKYTIKGSDGKQYTITIGNKTEGGDGEWLAPGSYCQTKEKKLDDLQPGDLILYVWSEKYDHTAIFIEWKDKPNHLAILFDWNGAAQGNPWGIAEGQKDKNGKACTKEDIYINKDKNPIPFCAIYRYYPVDLSDNIHPVYVYQNPYIFSDTQKESIKQEAPVSSTAPKETTISSTTPVSTTVGEKIYRAAIDFVNSGSTDNAARFVARSLINAGVGGISVSGTVSSTIPSDVASIASIIDKNSGFSEINIDNSKVGDIVLLGKECKEPYSIGIIGLISDSDKSIHVYTNLNNKVTIEKIPYVSTIEKGIYIYKAYRYTADTKETVSLRFKWNLDSAIAEIDRLLKLPNRNKGGTYIDNKIFADQLIFDGLLTEKECGDARYYAPIIGTGQKRMDWFKTLLQNKKASSVSGSAH